MTAQKTRLVGLTAIAAVAISGASYAQTQTPGSSGAGAQTQTAGSSGGGAQTRIVGSSGSGAGWQTWIPDDSHLNDNSAPYWDVPWGASGNYGGGSAEKNAGFCLTSTGDCQGIGSALFAPGALQFWGMPYDSENDSGGARDDTVYFHSTGGKLRATLFLNASAYATEINEFGWFETNSGGTVVGARHMLFQGTGDSSGTLTPDPVGKTVAFKPTPYFGYYYSDVSEPTSGTPSHGCYAYTLFKLDDPRCTEKSGHQGDHDFVVFTDNPGSGRATYWIAGEDPADCTNQDGDCNLTMVKVAPDGGN